MAPKRNVNAFSLFVREVRDALTKEGYRGKTDWDTVKHIASQRWNDLSKEEQRFYKDKAREEKQDSRLFSGFVGVSKGNAASPRPGGTSNSKGAGGGGSDRPGGTTAGLALVAATSNNNSAAGDVQVASVKHPVHDKALVLKGADENEQMRVLQDEWQIVAQFPVKREHDVKRLMESWDWDCGNDTNRHADKHFAIVCVKTFGDGATDLCPEARRVLSGTPSEVSLVEFSLSHGIIYQWHRSLPLATNLWDMTRGLYQSGGGTASAPPNVFHKNTHRNVPYSTKYNSAHQNNHNKPMHINDNRSFVSTISLSACLGRADEEYRQQLRDVFEHITRLFHARGRLFCVRNEWVNVHRCVHNMNRLFFPDNPTKRIVQLPVDQLFCVEDLILAQLKFRNQLSLVSVQMQELAELLDPDSMVELGGQHDTGHHHKEPALLALRDVQVTLFVRGVPDFYKLESVCEQCARLDNSATDTDHNEHNQPVHNTELVKEEEGDDKQKTTEKLMSARSSCSKAVSLSCVALCTAFVTDPVKCVQLLTAFVKQLPANLRPVPQHTPTANMPSEHHYPIEDVLSDEMFEQGECEMGMKVSATASSYAARPNAFNQSARYKDNDVAVGRQKQMSGHGQAAVNVASASANVFTGFSQPATPFPSYEFSPHNRQNKVSQRLLHRHNYKTIDNNKNRGHSLSDPAIQDMGPMLPRNPLQRAAEAVVAPTGLTINPQQLCTPSRRARGYLHQHSAASSRGRGGASAADHSKVQAIYSQLASQSPSVTTTAGYTYCTPIIDVPPMPPNVKTIAQRGRGGAQARKLNLERGTSGSNECVAWMAVPPLQPCPPTNTPNHMYMSGIRLIPLAASLSLEQQMTVPPPPLVNQGQQLAGPLPTPTQRTPPRHRTNHHLVMSTRITPFHTTNHCHAGIIRSLSLSPPKQTPAETGSPTGTNAVERSWLQRLILDAADQAPFTRADGRPLICQADVLICTQQKDKLQVGARGLGRSMANVSYDLLLQHYQRNPPKIDRVLD